MNIKKVLAGAGVTLGTVLPTLAAEGDITYEGIDSIMPILSDKITTFIEGAVPVVITIAVAAMAFFLVKFGIRLVKSFLASGK